MKNSHTSTRDFSYNRNVIRFIIFITFLLVAVMFSFAQNVTFTDTNFKNALLANDPVIDTSGDGEIQISEAEATLEIDVYNYAVDITSLGGIEAFTNLTSLNAGANALTSVDLSSNTAITSLFLQANQLESIDVTMLTELETLSIGSNLFSTIDLSQNTKLVTLYIGGVFYLNSLNVSALTNLETFWFSSNGNLTSIDLSNNTKLKNVRGDYTNITSLDVSMLPDLDYLNIQNTQITSLDMTNNPNLAQFYALNMSQLSTLKLANGNNSNMLFGNVRVSNVPNLTCISVDDPDYAVTTWDTYFDVPVTPTKYCDLSDPVYIPDTNFKAALVGDNSINTNEDSEISFTEAQVVESIIADNQGILDLTGLEAFSNLTTLWLTSNSIVTADLTSNTLLETAVLNSNFGLTSVDVSGLTELLNFQVKGGDLTELDVSTNTKLQGFEFYQNDIAEIDISNNPDLRHINFSFNDLTELDVSNNLELRTLNFWSNQVSTPLDISQHPHITTVQFSNNQISEVNLANGFNENITLINGSGNPATCVKVDDKAYSEAEWAHKFNEGVNFSDTYCDLNDLVNIPDENFKVALLAYDPVIDTNEDMEISYGEAQAFTGFLNMGSKGINDATGIEAFTGVTVLHFTSNNLTSVDLSQNTALTFLAVNDNELTSLDLSNNPLLTGVFANINLLESIDVSNNTLIRDLLVQQNQLTALDVANIPALERLLANDNLISEFDLRSNPNIDEFKINDNSLTSLYLNNGNPENIFNFDISGNAELTCALVDDAEYSTLNWTNVDEGLSFSDTYCDPTDPVYIPDTNFKAALIGDNSINTNEDIEISYEEAEAFTGTIVVNSGTQGVVSDLMGVEAFINLEVIQLINHDIAAFDASNHPKLRNLILPNNDLMEIDITANPALTFVNLQSNQISEIDVSNNTNLRTLKMSHNQLSEIDVSARTLLQELTLGSNNLSAVDITNNPDLQIFDAFDNTISTLDLSQNTALRYLNVSNTDLTSIDVSQQPDLLELRANSSELVSVNLKNGANTELNVINLINNFNLTCVEVDDVDYAEANWSDNVDEGVDFRISCDPNAPVNIPDPNFKAALVSNGSINTNSDSEISYAEAEAFAGKIEVFNQGITDATGIEAFINLTELNLTINDLTEIDLTRNTELVSLDLSRNEVASLDLSNNTKLVVLDLAFHMLTDGIDLSNNIMLEEVIMNGNGPTSLTSLDVSQNINLKTLAVQNNPDLSSIDLSNNTELILFQAVNDSFESIDFTNNTKLEYIGMANNLLSSIDVSNQSNLITLVLDNFGTNENSITSIDVSNNPLLEGLYFQGNPITSIDVSNNPALKNIRISGSQVTALNLDSNPLLEVIQAENITTLISLSVLNGNNSNITTFNTTGSTNLECIRVNDVALAEANWTIDPANEFCCFVTIPDANFKAALLANTNINTDMDEEISCDEAEAYTGQVQASDDGINSIAGIEHFPNITILQVHGNNLESVDLSANTLLETLWLSRNALNSIDLTANTAITDLRIDSNVGLSTLTVGNLPALATLHAHTTSVAQIDLSNNGHLEDLVMHTTSLQSLDLTSNPNLWRVYVYDNQLSEFDLRNGNNSGITSFRAEGNDLTCISVDDVAYSETNWSSVDGAAAFSTDCSNGANDILMFSFSEQTGAATIDATNHTIEIEVEIGTSLTALEPTITVSDGANTSPSGLQDFTNAVTYTVTAENYDEQDWAVTVTINIAPIIENPFEDSYSETEGFESVQISYETIFSDADGDELEISVESSNENVVTAEVIANNQIQINEVGLGESTITVTADDGNGGSISEDFTFTVTEAATPLGFEDELEVKVYPNPTIDFINIDASKSLKVQMIDLNGRVLRNKTGQNIRLNLKDIKSGMYILQITDGETSISQRIIKAN
ncbi:T9SS type A sorting domain-containing protein [Ekhidna sp. To15]|uniref:T9SS type A sorting domain-containing protein n=1 Tax=Ekhidna sp. To15 TaxID=3395267 RepID=UPI003F5267A2